MWHSYLTRPGAWWIRWQHRRFHPLGRALHPVEREPMLGYFEESLLSDVRIHQLETWSAMIPLHLPRMAAITLGDTIVLARGIPTTGPEWSRLLFHELVHVVQYRLLGIDEFAARYLGGWVGTGFRYLRIPLEQDVRELEIRIVEHPTERFPVLAEVEKQLAASS